MIDSARNPSSDGIRVADPAARARSGASAEDGARESGGVVSEDGGKAAQVSECRSPPGTSSDQLLPVCGAVTHCSRQAMMSSTSDSSWSPFPRTIRRIVRDTSSRQRASPGLEQLSMQHNLSITFCGGATTADASP